MESALTIHGVAAAAAPRPRRAAAPAADLPLAVGPAISTARASPIRVQRKLHEPRPIAHRRRIEGAAGGARRRHRAAARSIGRRELPAHPDWLSPGEACDIPFEGEAATALAARPRGARRPADRRERRAGGRPPQAAARRRHGFHADRAGMHRRAGRRDRRARRDRGDHRARHARRDRLRAGAARARRAAARAFAAEVVDAAARGADRDHAGRARAGRDHARAGAHTALVSGGFTAFAEPIARQTRLRRARAPTCCSCEAGAFTGFVAEPILGRDAKEEALARADGTARPRRRRKRSPSATAPTTSA